MTTVPCKGVGCTARIAWIRTKRGKMAPVDPEPVEAHLVLGSTSGRRLSLMTEAGDMYAGERLEEPGPRTTFVRGYVSHYATCPAHTQFRKGIRRPTSPAV
jgi:hypothetical protein